MNNLSTIATYLSRVSGQLQPMLEKVQGMDRRTFLLEAAALLALTSCAETSGKAGPAPMISFTPSSVPLVKRSPRQLLAECNVQPMLMPKTSPLRRRSSRMKPRFITMHNTENPSADAMQHARALNNGALRCNWHYTVDPYVTMQHLPLNETGRHADRGGPGDMYSIGIEMCEKRGQRHRQKPSTAPPSWPPTRCTPRTSRCATWCRTTTGRASAAPICCWTTASPASNGPGSSPAWDYYHRCIS